MMNVIAFPSWDTRLTLIINGWHSPWWDRVMLTLTNGMTWMPLFLLIVWFLWRKLGVRGLYVILFAGITLSLCDMFCADVIKPFFTRIRPSREPVLANLIHVAAGRGGRYGFVSNHAATAFCLALIVTWSLGRHVVSWLMWPWAILFSYTRIYIGKHYLLDILGGMVVGMLFAVCCMIGLSFFARWLQARKRRTCAK